MFFAYFDSSGLVKRYVPEPGSTTVVYLFGRMPLNRMFVLSVGMAEVVSILVQSITAIGSRLPLFSRP